MKSAAVLLSSLLVLVLALTQASSDTDRELGILQLIRPASQCPAPTNAKRITAPGCKACAACGGIDNPACAAKCAKCRPVVIQGSSIILDGPVCGE